MQENNFESVLPPVLDSPDSQDGNKPWLKRSRASNFKVSPDVKKRRRNYRFKKLLVPKNPLMILNELKSGLIFQIKESIINNVHTEFTATVEYEPGKVFSGKGGSKKLAQQAAAEAALKGLFFYKLLEQLPNKEMEDHDVDMKPVKEDVQADQVGETPIIPEDDTPWCSLASLAFYKLIQEWKAPILGATSPPSTLPDSTKSSAEELRKLPENPNLYDPVMLLHQISPTSKFSEIGREMKNNEHFFTLSVEFNGQKFDGTANRKKDAKKICARKALETIGVVY